MNLLGRARKMLQGIGPAEPPRPQFYDVRCPEGHRLSGQRTEGYQALRCPGCGEGVFILPVSPLPDPPPPKENARKASAEAPVAVDEGPIALSDAPPPPGSVDDEAEVEWIDPEPEGSAPPAAPPVDDGFEAILPEMTAGEPKATRKAAVPAVRKAGPTTDRGPSRGPSTSQQRRAPANAGRPATPAGKIRVKERPSLGRRLGRHKPALILFGVILLVAATVGYRWWKNRLENLPQIAEASLAEGEAALEAGNFAVAKNRLRKAAVALERLGADEASKVRQSAEEAAIFADLCDPPLEDLIGEAARSASPEAWKERFDSHYRQQSILLDAHIEIPEDGPKVVGLDYRVLSGSKPLVGWIDIHDLNLLKSKTFKKGDPILFGARIDAITLQPDGTYRIALDPESGLFITDFEALSKVEGWGSVEAPSAEEPAR